MLHNDFKKKFIAQRKQLRTHLPETPMWIRFLDPLFFGKYPLWMKKLVGERLPEISSATSKFLVGSLDFIGINHYTSLYTRNDRTRIHKLVMQDALSDAAVITTGKLLMLILTPFFNLPFFYLLCLKQALLLKFIGSFWYFLLFFILAYRRGAAIGEKVCSDCSVL